MVDELLDNMNRRAEPETLAKVFGESKSNRTLVGPYIDV